MRLWRTTLLVAATVSLGGCASVFLWAIHASSPIDWNGHDYIDLPLKLDSRGRPAIPVQIHGKEFLALLDSGSPVPNFRLSTAASLGLEVRKSGSISRLDEDVELHLGSGTIELTMAYVSDIQGDTDLTLGQEIFSQAVVDMSISESRLTLHRPGTFTEPAMPAIPVDLHYSRPTIPLRVKGRTDTVCAVIDTGFDSGIALSRELVKKLDLPPVPGRKVVYRGVDGKRIEVAALAPLPEVSFGGQQFREVPVVGAVPNESGSCRNLVGMAVLSRHRVIFDIEKKRLWLLPTS